MKHLKINRKFLIVLLLTMICAAFVFAQDAGIDETVQVEEFIIPEGIHNNSFYRESVRLNNLANDAFQHGDYDASAGLAQRAIYFTERSNMHVSDQLIREARRLLTLADRNNVATRFPNNYNEGKKYYDSAVVAYSNEEWIDAIDDAKVSIGYLAAFEATGTAARPATGTGTTTTRPATGTSTSNPRQYTVRTWVVERDCLWNIAGYPWVYNDPWKWRILYDANKSRMPEPDNPHLIEPGMILEIPNLEGENRQGMWRP